MIAHDEFAACPLSTPQRADSTPVAVAAAGVAVPGDWRWREMLFRLTWPSGWPVAQHGQRRLAGLDQP